MKRPAKDAQVANTQKKAIATTLRCQSRATSNVSRIDGDQDGRSCMERASGAAVLKCLW